MYCVTDMFERGGDLYIVTHDGDVVLYNINKVRLSDPSIKDKVDFVAGKNIDLAKVKAQRNAIVAEIKKSKELEILND